MIIPIISAYIADSIADRPGMLSGFAGGLIVCKGISITSISTSSPSLLAGIIAGFLAGFVSLMLRKLFSYLPQCLKGIEQLKYIDNAPASPAERQQAGKITWDSFWIKGIAPSEINEIPLI